MLQLGVFLRFRIYHAYSEHMHTVALLHLIKTAEKQSRRVDDVVIQTIGVILYQRPCIQILPHLRHHHHHHHHHHHRILSTHQSVTHSCEHGCAGCRARQLMQSADDALPESGREPWRSTYCASQTSSSDNEWNEQTINPRHDDHRLQGYLLT